ncbi:dihydroorotase [Orenia metallireducens]|uniref:Dihydroorotase n=1 Tax=Orenia metallireducens TaxID=1413210 RepID=A0A285FEE9_9FIRM|nr:dihydroorotase [Orenia metallireducens]PRX33502.1 dihydroorotase [Orenia metallireducens]SNY09682.1 dihydroorotase [Orenia metallireducens]
MSKLLLKGGKIIDPIQGSKAKAGEILIVDGKIAKLGENLAAEDAQVIDIEGKVVSPGLIDIHVHLREPGFEHKETIETGTKSAAKGGFTSVACMPNTDPVIDNQTLVEGLLSIAKRDGVVNVYPIGAITKGSQGKELAEIANMKEAGIVAISDDGHPVMNAEMMRLALDYSKDFDLTIVSHCEDKNLAGDGVVNQGYYSTITGLNPISSSSESVMVGREILLAEEAGAKVHIAHISTKESVDLVRQAKKRGVKVTCEVTPHHFTLTDELITSFDTNTKMNPPLRSAEDVAAIKEGLKDGTIDVIATDHAPHAEEEKDVEYNYAPFGIVGLETAVGLVITELVESGILTLEEAIAKLTINPAQVIGIDKGTLEVGKDADITIIDVDDKWEVKTEELVSKSKNTPFGGYELQGRAVMTIVGGKIVYSSDE